MNELLSLCAETCEAIFRGPSEIPILQRLRKDPPLQKKAHQIHQLLHTCLPVYHPNGSTSQTMPILPLTAVTWNLERGKYLDEVLEVLKTHPKLSSADLYFFTEVDWGMARSKNRNVTEELGKALGFFAYFAPSYFNLTQGHGAERHSTGQNSLGLHGKAILSRYPLENLRVVSMPNLTDKLASKEARLGEKRAILGDLRVGEKTLTIGCAHLDAFSSSKTRARQLVEVAKACDDSPIALLAGDWNTNTLNSTSSLTVFFSVLHQLLVMKPKRTIQEHHSYPERYYDRPLFSMLREFGFEVEHLNEIGEGTFDLITSDDEMRQMVSDQFPEWLLTRIRRLIENAGGKLSLKLDWFAGKSIEPLERKIIRLKGGEDYHSSQRPSDHHPVWLKFTLE